MIQISHKLRQIVLELLTPAERLRLTHLFE